MTSGKWPFFWKFGIVLGECLLLLAAPFPSSGTPFPGSLSSVQHLGTLSIQELDEAALSRHPLLSPDITSEVLDSFHRIGRAQNAVALYRVFYHTTDPQGQSTEASGLVLLPEAPGAHPWVSYQQGTILNPHDAPSRPDRNPEALIVLHIFAARGYVVSLPDYLGQGFSALSHPYLHAETEASAAFHLLEATRRFCAQHRVRLDDSLFLIGFSQGGHATMALHRLLESGGRQPSPVTASVAIAGPYDLEICWDWWQHAQDPAIPFIVNRMVSAYKSLYAPFGKLPFRSLRRALASNDVSRWSPRSPVGLFYGTQDPLVPWSLAEQTASRLKAHGAFVFTHNLGSRDHGGSCIPGLFSAKLWFDALRP